MSEEGEKKSFSRFTSRFGTEIPYAPNSLITPMVAGAQRDGLNLEDQDTNNLYNRRFPLEDGKALILEALQGFDPLLAAKAGHILETGNYNNGEADMQAEQKHILQPHSRPPSSNNPFLESDYELNINEGTHWNLQPVPPGQCQLMRCLPAESEKSQYDPANPHPYAVIEFQYDCTIDSVVYMAHEIGHAIADDYGLEAGHTYQDNPSHIKEMQAYLVQHIIHDHLQNHTDPSIADAASSQFKSTMRKSIQDLPDNSGMEERPMSLLTSLGFYNHIKDMKVEDKRQASENLLGRHGPKNINQVLAEADIKDPAVIKSWAEKTVDTVFGKKTNQPDTGFRSLPRPNSPAR